MRNAKLQRKFSCFRTFRPRLSLSLSVECLQLIPSYLLNPHRSAGCLLTARISRLKNTAGPENYINPVELLTACNFVINPGSARVVAKNSRRDECSTVSSYRDLDLNRRVFHFVGGTIRLIIIPARYAHQLFLTLSNTRPREPVNG